MGAPPRWDAAAALDAAELWIWTDVDGIMSADPRLVPDAQVLEEITYAEAAELAYNGAKVLHPRTLAPLVEKKIPVWSKNSFAPEKPGTRIVPSMAVPQGARAVASMRNVALVSLEPASAEMNGVQLMARSLDAMAGADVKSWWFPVPATGRASVCWCAKTSWTGRSMRWNRPCRWSWRIITCAPSRWTATWACWPRWARACKARPDWPAASLPPFRGCKSTSSPSPRARASSPSPWWCAATVWKRL